MPERIIKYTIKDGKLVFVREMKRFGGCYNKAFYVRLGENGSFSSTGVGAIPFGKINGKEVRRFGMRMDAVAYGIFEDGIFVNYDVDDIVFWKYIMGRRLFDEMTPGLRESFLDNGVDGLKKAMGNHVYSEIRSMMRLTCVEHEALSKVARALENAYICDSEVLEKFVLGGIRSIVRKIVNSAIPHEFSAL